MVDPPSGFPTRNLPFYRYNRTNKSYTEDLGNEVTLTLMLIPAGAFMMGGRGLGLERFDERLGLLWFDYEEPKHLVRVAQFLMGRFPVTQAQWRVVAGYPRVDKELDLDPSAFKGDNRPVEQVSWEDAQEFCRRLSVKTGETYRLPSEAEWEYACRAGTETACHFGKTITTEMANYKGTSSYNNAPTRKYRCQTTDVGSFAANDWGLHDMHGNVCEWCEDDYHGSYEGAPDDGSAWVESERSDHRVMRGGSWLDIPMACRSAARFYDSRVYRSRDVGFRVCCVPSKTNSAWERITFWVEKDSIEQAEIGFFKGYKPSTDWHNG